VSLSCQLRARSRNPAAPPVVTYTTGMTGVADGQAARLNVLSPGATPPAIGVVRRCYRFWIVGATF